MMKLKIKGGHAIMAAAVGIGYYVNGLAGALMAPLLMVVGACALAMIILVIVEDKQE